MTAVFLPLCIIFVFGGLAVGLATLFNGIAPYNIRKNELSGVMGDWIAFVINVLFVTAALFLLVYGDDWRTAASIMVFFGLGAWVMGDVIWMRSRFRHWISKRAQVELPGYVPFSNSTRRFWLLTAGLLCVGVFWSFVLPFDVVATRLGYFLLVFGLLLAMALLSGRIRRFIMLTEEGLCVRDRWGSYVVEWDNIKAIQSGEMIGQYAVGITPVEMSRLFATLESRDRTKAKQKLMQSVRENMAMGFAPIVIYPLHFGLDPAFTFKALEGYWRNAAARSRLAVRRIHGGA